MTKSTITDERVTSVIERLEHYACNLKWTNVRGAQDLLTAADGLRELQERRKADSEPVAYTDERNLGYIDRGRETAYLWGKQNSEAGDIQLYRHAQQLTVTGNGLGSALSLTQMQIDWICNTCATIYHTANDDVAQGYIDEIRATLERMKSIDTAQPAPGVPESMPDSVYEILCAACGDKAWAYADLLWSECCKAIESGGKP